MSRSGLSILVAGMAALAQKPPVDRMPAAGALLERHVRESGGIEALRSASTQTTRGKFRFPQAGLSGKISMFTDDDGRSYQVLEALGGGKLEVINTGDVEWERSASAGTKLRRVASSPGSLLRPAPGSAAFWSIDAPAARTTGRGLVEGKPCWQVEVQPSVAGRITRLCFDWDTGLLVEVAVAAGERGSDFQVEMKLMSYKQVGAVKLPHIIETGSGEGLMRVEVEEIKIGEKPPEEMFEVPAEILAMVRRQVGEVEFKEAQEDPNRPRLKRKKK